jgi:hypothetical protein
MSRLPEDLNNRFILYLNVLPVVEKVLMYVLFFTGGLFLLGSVLRIVLLNYDLQKKAARMDFSHENSQELKRIHKNNMKSMEKRPTSDKAKEAAAFYSCLLAPSEDIHEDNLDTTDLNKLAGDAVEGIDNYSCDNTENPPVQYDMRMTNFSLPKKKAAV